MSEAHMQVHTNGESWEKQPGQKSGLNWAKSSLGRPDQAGRRSPFWAWFGAPFYLATLQIIYSAPAKIHASIHSSSAAEEQRREGHHPAEERVEMDD
jgi:hypothetical protein